jgi:hypothetical protein
MFPICSLTKSLYALRSGFGVAVAILAKALTGKHLTVSARDTLCKPNENTSH